MALERMMRRKVCKQLHVLLKQVMERNLAIDLETGRIEDLNETAWEIMNYCSEPVSVAEIYRRLGGDLDDPNREDIEIITTFLDGMVAKGLLYEVDD